MSEYVRVDKQILIAVLGIGSSIVCAAVLGLIEVYTGYALYSWSIWFIIPIGAIGAGFAASSGYYLGAKLFNQKPAGGVLFNMVSASISAYLLVHYVPYYLLEVEQGRLKDLVGFWTFLDFGIRHTSLSITRAHVSTGELGPILGYGLAGLQVLGFTTGGLLVFLWLSRSPFCETCSLYLATKNKIVRFSSDGKAVAEVVEHFSKNVANGEYAEAIARINDFGVTEKPGHRLRLSLTQSECAGCRINHLDNVVAELESNSWSDIEESRQRIFVRDSLGQYFTAKLHPSF